MDRIKFLEDIFERENGFLCFYGEAATGKTTLMKLGCIKKLEKGKKVLFIDTENSFSVDRFKQLAGKDYENLLKNLMIFRIKSFKDQQLKINNLRKFLKSEKICLVAVDTISYYYRTLFRSKPDLAKLMMKSQLKILKDISKDILILITNQVYGDINKNRVEAISGKTIGEYCDNIIRLEKSPREIIFEKPEGKKILFKIVEEGIVEA